MRRRKAARKARPVAAPRDLQRVADGIYDATRAIRRTNIASDDPASRFVDE